jgi:hypothetical protein
MTPVWDPRQVFVSTNLESYAREPNEEDSCRSNCGAGFLGGICEAFGRHLGGILEAFGDRYLEPRRLWEASWKHLGSIWWHLGRSWRFSWAFRGPETSWSKSMSTPLCFTFVNGKNKGFRWERWRWVSPSPQPAHKSWSARRRRRARAAGTSQKIIRQNSSSVNTV